MSRPDSKSPKSPALWRLLCTYCWNIVQQEPILAWISKRIVYAESSVWDIHVWAVTQGFGTFCPPSWLSSNEHAQSSSLMSVQNLRLVLYFMCASIEDDWRLRDCADAQARMSLRHSHMRCDGYRGSYMTGHFIWNVKYYTRPNDGTWKKTDNNVQGSLRICNEYKKVPII